VSDITRDTVRLLNGTAHGRQLRIPLGVRTLRVPVPPSLPIAVEADELITAMMPRFEVQEYVESGLPGVWVTRLPDDHE
jgi:hypothetical protein